MLSLRSVNQFYGQNHTLWDINLELPRGQCTVLLGRNGVGKTTLVNCIMGHVPVVSGSMTWQPADQPPQNLLLQPMERRAALGISHVPQGRQLFSQLSVEENLQVAQMAGRGAPRRIPPLIYSLFPHLRQMRARRAGDLCVGAQRQLAIGRALAQEPALLILDEPTAGVPLDRRRYRQRDPPTQPRIGHDHFTGGASAAVRAPGGGPFLPVGQRAHGGARRAGAAG